MVIPLFAVSEDMPRGNALLNGAELAQFPAVDVARKGRPYKDETMHAALMRALRTKKASGARCLDLVARKVVDLAIEGNMHAIEFVFEKADRLPNGQDAMSNNLTRRVIDIVYHGAPDYLNEPVDAAFTALAPGTVADAPGEAAL